MFRKPRSIILAAIALYAIALSVAWQQVDMRADRRMEAMLESAETGYSAVIDGEIDAALRNVGGAVLNLIGQKCVSLPLERMQELAKTFNIDEINIVNGEGIAIGSNIPSVLGFDFRVDPSTREFMSLTNATATMVSQPFRSGVANPDMYCKYFGMAFPARDGFLQLGITVEHLRQNMYSYTEAEADQILREWHFSVRGWYERADHDQDFEPGRIFRRWSVELEEEIVGRYFDYRGYRYAAFLPESYCYSQRNAAFAVTALVLGVLLFFFTYVLVRLAHASAKLENMHTAAEARTAADLALARTIQMSALPSADGVFMERLEFSLFAECYPAREVGGDFYDFFHLPDGRIAFLVADVSGKGIPGAMFMMEAKNVIKSCLVESVDIAAAVTEANRRLCGSNRAELFVTAWIGILDGEGTVEYVNAGHNRPFVRRCDGMIEKVMGKGGRFLGMFEDASYRANVLRLGRGDVLYLYTDGVTEAMNAKGEQYGERRFCAEIEAGKRRIKEAVDEFVAGAEQSDDMTGMAIFWHGQPEVRRQDFAADETSLALALKFIRESFAGRDGKAVSAALNAADEVTSNIVNYSGASGYRIEAEQTADRLRLRFSDDGKPYNPLLHIDPDTHAAIEKRPIGGLGLVVVKRLSDRVAYSRENGRNVLTLIVKCEWV